MNAEAMAINTLLDGNITHLPIIPEDVEGILRRLDWKIFRYDLRNQDDISKLERLNLLQYTSKYKTFSYKLGDKKIVVSPSWLTAAESAHSLAHELGHIKHGHFSETGILGCHQDATYDDQQEAEAEEFARAFLAPYCILRKAHSLSEESISRYTSLDSRYAKIRASECRHIYRRLDPIENRLVNNFQNYIEQHTRVKKNIMSFASVLICAVLLFVSTAIDKKHQTNDTAQIIQMIDSPVQNEVSENASSPIPIQAESQDIANNSIVINGFEYNSTLTVFKTRTGKKFHKEHCRHIKNRTGVTSMSIRDAFDIGLESCADCF